MWKRVNRRLRRFVACERGTQMIEFTFALPFLLLLFAGAVELGRLFYTYTTLTKATMVGARYLTTSTVSASGFTAAEVTAAKNLIVCGASSCSGRSPLVTGLDETDITITPPPTTGSVRYVTVQISYGYTPVVFDLGTMTGDSSLSLNYTLTPQATMRYMLD